MKNSDSKDKPEKLIQHSFKAFFEQIKKKIIEEILKYKYIFSYGDSFDSKHR